MSTWLDDLTNKSHLKSKIGFKGELEFAGATEDDRAGRTVRFRIVRRPEELGSAHPFSAFTRRRGKQAGSIFSASIASIASGEVVYAREVMLTGWSDGPAGAVVSFQLDEQGEQNPFLGYSRPSRQVAGTRFMAVLLEKADDESLVDQEAAESLEENPHPYSSKRPRGEQTLSNVAAMIVKNPRFHDFLRETVEAVDWNAHLADRWVKTTIGIASKTELDGASPAALGFISIFHNIRKRFVNWQEEQGDQLNPYR